MQPRIIAATAMLGIALGTTAAKAEDAGYGAALYAQHCATCHGEAGKGDGPLTELLTEKVPDLTALAAGNEGAFPMLDVIHIIDGRTGLRGHGGPMPTFGDVFMANLADESTPMTGDISDVLETRGRILSLALYLESIQQ
ncbi:cytochrome c [Pseudoruegeria sp. HB172150]|uniref:c-type cytochrome n=1 Tax=Pseudoruegeria sp. HB172150 TaxID=2721164 RepID=UPI0020A65B58|nr:c-type cytochrome [Pseudoruegeria sp. HB172150]